MTKLHWDCDVHKSTWDGFEFQIGNQKKNHAPKDAPKELKSWSGCYSYCFLSLFTYFNTYFSHKNTLASLGLWKKSPRRMLIFIFSNLNPHFAHPPLLSSSYHYVLLDTNIWIQYNIPIMNLHWFLYKYFFTLKGAEPTTTKDATPSQKCIALPGSLFNKT